MSFHRYIVITLEIGIGPEIAPSAGGPGAAAGAQRAPDYQEVVDDLKQKLRNLKPKNKAGKSYDIAEVNDA